MVAQGLRVLAPDFKDRQVAVHLDKVRDRPLARQAPRLDLRLRFPGQPVKGSKAAKILECLRQDDRRLVRRTKNRLRLDQRRERPVLSDRSLKAGKQFINRPARGQIDRRTIAKPRAAASRFAAS